MATTQQQNEFINKIAPIIRKVAIERGYKVCSPVIAQACCESNYGISQLSAKYNNFFGLKCGSSWKGDSVNMKTKEEYTVGTLTTIKDNFRAYKDMTQGVNGYYDFINTKRYANLKDAKTPREYLEFIKADGYATSSTYVNTCMSFVTKHNLTKYDDMDLKEIEVPTITVKEQNITPIVTDKPLPTLRLGSNDKNLGDSYVKSWQTFLQTLGLYKGAIDGIFGTNTHFAVWNYQSSYNRQHAGEKGFVPLAVDGVVGKNTWNSILGAKK